MYVSNEAGRWGWNCWLENECFSTRRFWVNSSLCLAVLVETKMFVIVLVTLKRLKRKNKQTKETEVHVKVLLRSSLDLPKVGFAVLVEM